MYKFSHDMRKHNINFAKQTTQFKWQAASNTVVAWCCQHSWSRRIISQAPGEE